MIINKNPILTGFHPDPCIIRVEDDYYLVTSTFQWFPGVELYHSKDLINWEVLPSPLNRVSQLDMKGIPNSGGVWAPCLSYCDGTFYLIYTVVKNFHGIFKDTHNYLVTTTDIRGSWSEPIYLNSSGFDPSLFHDEDGKKYLVNMRWDHRLENHAFEGIVLQEYSPESKKLIGKPINIYKGTNIGATEAPHLYKKNGYYYLMVAEGGTLYHHGVRLARSKNLLGPYVSDEYPLLTMRDDVDKQYYLQRTGHASLVETGNGKAYIAYLCGRPISENKRCILGRETCLDEVYWNEEGWLRLKNNSQRPSLLYTSYLVEYPTTKDNGIYYFNGSLPLQFKSLRIPFSAMGNLDERPGFLRLYGHESITSWNILSLVGRRLDAFNTRTTIKMEYIPENFQQLAGLTVFYDSYNFYYLYMTSNNDHNELRLLIRNNLNFSEPLGKGISIGKHNIIWLRVEINELTLKFYYSIDGKNYLKIGEDFNGSNLSDESYSEIGHEGHTGTFIAMTCQDLSGNNKHADFEYFIYEKLV